MVFGILNIFLKIVENSINDKSSLQRVFQKHKSADFTSFPAIEWES